MNTNTLFKTLKDILLEVFKEVFKQKTDLNIQNFWGDTVVMYAFMDYKDKYDLMKILKQKPDLNIQNKCGSTVTMFAFGFCNERDVLLELLKQKPNLTLKNCYNKTALDFALEYYVKNPNFEFGVLEKLYNENCKQDKKLFNPKYIKLRNKYKVLPLILFRHYQRCSV
tara:strand:+ start:6149 stop:6652 length:504 start_codon:yes stop_codon:yes gene_type:complete